MDAAVISSSQPVFPKPGPVTPVTSNTSVHDQESLECGARLSGTVLVMTFPLTCEMGWW